MTGAVDQVGAGFRVQGSGAGVFTLSWLRADVGELTLTASADPDDLGRTAVPLDPPVGGVAEVAGLPQDRRWYFTATDPSGREVTASTRQVALDGAQNARDIGGYLTADGRIVRWGKVFRSDSLSDLTDADVDYLDRSGILTVVDFRGVQEVESAGPDRLSDRTVRVHTPVMDDSTDAFAAAMSKALGEGDSEAVVEMLGAGQAEELSEHGFVRQLDRPVSMAGYADTLRRIADAPDAALLYHCAGGKDRTGMMTALLMGILGVPDQAIIDDFVLSNHFNSARNKQRFAALAARGVDIELVRPLMEQRPSQIVAVLAAVRERYGDWDAFARESLELTDEQIATLRAALLHD